jgi:hypothetical protein
VKRRAAPGIESLCALAAGIALIPIWLYRCFPSQDGPSHLYNALLLGSRGPVTSATFEPVLRLFPNWSAFLLLAAFGRLFTPFIAQQMVVSLCVVSIPAATLYLQKSFKTSADPTALVGVMLAFSYLLFMGFFNFILGCALFAFTVGFAWRRRATTPIAALYALLALTWVTHGLAFATTVAALVVLAALDRNRRALFALVPPIAAVAWSAWRRDPEARGYQDLAWHAKRLAALDPFAYFRAVHANLASAMSILMLIAIVVTLRRRRDWPPIAISAMLLVFFFIAPWSFGAGGAQGTWINDRFLMLFVITLPAWLDLPRPRVVLAILGVLAAIHLATTWQDIARLSAQIEPVVRCRGAIPEHTTIDVLGTPPRIATKLEPLRHVSAYLAVDRDVAWLANYEARLDDFPNRFRAGAPQRPAQYALVWRGATADGAAVCEGSGFRVVRLQ